MVPDRLWADERLDHIDVRLWCVISHVARGRDECEPTDAILAQKLNVSDRTIRRALDRLEAAQYIARRREGDLRVIALKPTGDGQELAEFVLKVAS